MHYRTGTKPVAKRPNNSGYNLGLRNCTLFLLVLGLVGCSKGPNDAQVRQAVLDRLTKAGMPLDAMEVSITAFEPKGNEGDATVSMKLKDSPGAAPMVMHYKLQQDGGKWVVTGIAGSEASPHGGGMPAPAPGAGSPHGGAMPAPEDLPPAGKKK